MKKNIVLLIILVTLIIILLGMVFFLVNDKTTEPKNDKPTEPKDVKKISVFLSKHLTDSQIDELGDSILKIDGVYSIQFVSEEQSLEETKERFKGNKDIFESWEKDNPFMPYYFVTITPSSLFDSVVAEIESLDNVHRVLYNQPISSYKK